MDLEASCSSVVNIEVIPVENYLTPQPNTENFMLCPLCNSEINLFFINFNEKLLMCKNTECEYPFGYEELQYFKEDKDRCSDTEVMSIKESCNETWTCAGSTACFSEIEKMHQIVYNDDNMCTHLTASGANAQEYILNSKDTPSSNKVIEVTKNIEKNIQEISNLTDTLKNANEKRFKMLKNPSWIRNLTNLQRKTGANLVKPIEIDLDHKSKDVRSGEITVNIGPADNELSTLKIEIIN